MLFGRLGRGDGRWRRMLLAYSSLYTLLLPSPPDFFLPSIYLYVPQPGVDFLPTYHTSSYYLYYIYISSLAISLYFSVGIPISPPMLSIVLQLNDCINARGVGVHSARKRDKQDILLYEKACPLESGWGVVLGGVLLFPWMGRVEFE
jgi:hypothetical protein